MTREKALEVSDALAERGQTHTIVVGVRDGYLPRERYTVSAAAATIREQVAHIARGCRSGRSHNPAVHEREVLAALVHIKRAFAETVRERDALERSLEACRDCCGDEHAEPLADALAALDRARQETSQ